MKKTQYTEAELNEITAIQEERSITRKSAIRIFEKGNRKIILTKARTTPVVVDVKSRAANDDSQVAGQTAAAAAPAKATPAPKPAAPSTPAGDARKEGIRLFQLAGKPNKQDFIHVYGE